MIGVSFEKKKKKVNKTVNKNNTRLKIGGGGGGVVDRYMNPHLMPQQQRSLLVCV